MSGPTRTIRVTTSERKTEGSHRRRQALSAWAGRVSTGLTPPAPLSWFGGRRPPPHLTPPQAVEVPLPLGRKVGPGLPPG